MTDSIDSRRGNLLSGQRIILDGGVSTDCNMVSLTPFLKEISPDSKVAVRRGYESALAKILAIQHLNSGDGSLISNIDGLNDRCPIQFGIDFVDTKLNIGTAATRLARRMINTDVPPCVFLGSYLSIVSATTSKFTASNGYPQISGTSTSSFLDDADDYPLFSRTTPSTKGHSKALLHYLKEELIVDQLALIYIADPYGYHYFQDLTEAIGDIQTNGIRGDKHNKFDLEAFSLLPDLSNLPEAMEFVKNTGFRHVFVVFYGEYLNNHSIMEEAIAHDVAGSESKINWLFGDDFLAPKDWIFDSSNPLVDAYKKTGIFTASGRGSAINSEDDKYKEFAKQLNTLKSSRMVTDSVRNASPPTKRRKSSDRKLRKKSPIVTQSTRQYSENEETRSVMDVYFDTMVSDPGDKDLAMDFWEELLLDDTFLHPEFLSHDIPYEYESVIMAGLALCNSVENTKSKNTNSALLFVDSEDFQNELVDTTIDGISGTVILDPKTGTRLENSTFYTIKNLIPEELVLVDQQIQKTRFWKQQVALLEPIVATNGEETNGRNDEHWVSIDSNNENNNGSTLPPLPDIPDIPYIIQPQPQPPPISETQYTSPISIDENDFVRLIQGLSCVLSITAALGCVIWTYSCRNQPIVRASKPLFLYLICCGVIIFASAILPFSIVGTSGALDDTGNGSGIISNEFSQLMANLCSLSIWLRTLGYAIVISALFSKTHRLDKVMCGAKLYQTARARVLIDFLLPLAAMLIINILILSLMTALHPVTYGIIPYEDPSSDGALAYESCIFTNDHRHKFWIPLVCWNISVLIYSLHRSWSERNSELEESSQFPSERPQIFNALLCSLLVSLLGIMIMLVVRDRDDPITSALVEATISFFFCVFVLFTIFTSKMRHVWRTFSNTNNISGDEYSDSLSRSSYSPTKEELKAENAGLRKRNQRLEEELILFPPSGPRSKNKTLTNFFGSFFGHNLGIDDDFEDEYTLTPSVEKDQSQKQVKEGDVDENRQEEQKEDKHTVVAPPKTSRFVCKKILEDIFFVSSDIIPSYSPDIRPSTLSEATTSWSLSREYMSLKQSSTSTSNKRKSSSYNNSSIYKTTPTSTNKSSPESKNKSTPESKSTPTLSESELQPHRSSFYKSPTPKRRGPEVEDYSTAPLERNKGSFASSMAPLGGSPPTPLGKYGYARRNSLAFSESPLENALKPKAQQTRNALRNSIDSSMMPLGDPSVTPSLSTGMDPRSIFRPGKRHSGGLDQDSSFLQKSEKPGGIPSYIMIFNYNDDATEEDLTQHAPEQVTLTLTPSAPESIPIVPRAVARRPSLGYDTAIPKDPQNPYRHCV